jgi:ABC-type Mn2+/Zn2+ transport system ATPase subunit
VVVLGQAGNVRVHVALLLEAAYDARIHERLQRSKHRRPPDGRFIPTEPVVELGGGELPASRGKAFGDHDPLGRYAFAGGCKSRGGGEGGAVHAATLSQARLRIMHRDMSATGSGLLLQNVSAGYGAGFVLRDVNLAVAPGALVGVIGPNGAGKSTLLKAILGLTPVVTGTIELDGRPVDGQRRRIAYVPQRDAVDWSFPISAEQVVMMGRYPELGWLRMPGRRERDAVRTALQRVGMVNLADRQIGSLSGGQQQRVFLARALVQDAAVLLLDEPLTGVDQTTEQLIVAMLRELRDAGATILQATHDLESAAETSDLLCFVNGRVVAYGPPADTFTPPTLHATFGGELLIIGADDHTHVHGGGHHGAVDHAAPDR